MYNSIFGWIVGGTYSVKNPRQMVHISLHTSAVDSKTHDLLRAFWEIEEPPSSHSAFTAEEQQALDHFSDNVARDQTGRYTVKLPWKESTPLLGCSKEQAVRRYLQNEKTLKRKGQWEKFQAVVDEYADLHHSEPVPPADLCKAEADCFYLPMHGLLKEASTTTKLRIVFDASAKTSTGYSLNDLLLPGPTLYPLLVDVFLNFRRFPIGMSSDISKMFREVKLHPIKKDFHHYIHRGCKSGKLQDWRMTRLTFGVTSSPFLATQVLRQVASDYEDEFPQEASIVRQSLYVDDCLTGADDVEGAI